MLGLIHTTKSSSFQAWVVQDHDSWLHVRPRPEDEDLPHLERRGARHLGSDQRGDQGLQHGAASPGCSPEAWRWPEDHWYDSVHVVLIRPQITNLNVFRIKQACSVFVVFFAISKHQLFIYSLKLPNKTEPFKILCKTWNALPKRPLYIPITYPIKEAKLFYHLWKVLAC